MNTQFGEHFFSRENSIEAILWNSSQCLIYSNFNKLKQTSDSILYSQQRIFSFSTNSGIWSIQKNTFHFITHFLIEFRQIFHSNRILNRQLCRKWTGFLKVFFLTLIIWATNILTTGWVNVTFETLLIFAILIISTIWKTKRTNGHFI